MSRGCLATREEGIIKSSDLDGVKKQLFDDRASENALKTFGDLRCTLLHFACLHGRAKIVEYLLQKKANVNAVNRFGVAPIHWASQVGNKEIFQVLVANGADVHAKTIYGYSALHYAMLRGSHITNTQWKPDKGFDFIIKFLIKRGLKLEHMTNNKNNCWSFMTRGFNAKSAEQTLVVLAMDTTSTMDDFEFYESVLNAQYCEKLPDLTKRDAESGETALGLAIANFRPVEIICKIAKIMYPSPNKYVHTIEKSAMMTQLSSNEAATKVPNAVINAANESKIKVRLKMKQYAPKLLMEFQQRRTKSDRVAENSVTQKSVNRHVVDECRSVAISNLEPKANNSIVFMSKESVIPKTKVEAVEPTKVDECKSVAIPNLEPKANNSTVFTSKESVIPKTKLDECKSVVIPNLEPKANSSTVFTSKESVIPKTKVEAVEPTKVTDVMPTGFAESHISSKDENLEERELCL